MRLLQWKLLSVCLSVPLYMSVHVSVCITGIIDMFIKLHHLGVYHVVRISMFSEQSACVLPFLFSFFIHAFLRMSIEDLCTHALINLDTEIDVRIWVWCMNSCLCIWEGIYLLLKVGFNDVCMWLWAQTHTQLLILNLQMHVDEEIFFICSKSMGFSHFEWHFA